MRSPSPGPNKKGIANLAPVKFANFLNGVSWKLVPFGGNLHGELVDRMWIRGFWTLRLLKISRRFLISIKKLTGGHTVSSSSPWPYDKIKYNLCYTLYDNDMLYCRTLEGSIHMEDDLLLFYDLFDDFEMTYQMTIGYRLHAEKSIVLSGS